MNKLLFGLLALVLSLPAEAAISDAAKYELNNRMGAVAHKHQLGTLIEQAESVSEDDTAVQSADGHMLERVARVTYDVAVHGGGLGDHGLGVYLPAKAVIIRSYFRITTQFSDSGSGTVALSCEDANNIKTATDITGNAAGTFVEGQSTGAASTFVGGIAAKCEITATVAGAAQDTGKLTAWVHYVVHD